MHPPAAAAAAAPGLRKAPAPSITGVIVVGLVIAVVVGAAVGLFIARASTNPPEEASRGAHEASSNEQ
jgi:hypothetical protein